MSLRRLLSTLAALLFLLGSAFGVFALFSPGHSSPLLRLEDASMPGGIYLMLPIAPTKRGQTVLFCPGQYQSRLVARLTGESGYCSGGSTALVKTLVALPGDSVTIDSTGVYVNGLLLPNSRPLQHTSDGRPVSYYPFNQSLDDGWCLTMSLYNPRSVDSRYFGPVECHRLWRALPLSKRPRAFEQQVASLFTAMPRAYATGAESLPARTAAPVGGTVH